MELDAFQQPAVIELVAQQAVTEVAEADRVVELVPVDAEHPGRRPDIAQKQFVRLMGSLDPVETRMGKLLGESRQCGDRVVGRPMVDE